MSSRGLASVVALALAGIVRAAHGQTPADSTRTATASDSSANGRALTQPIPSPPFPSGDWVGSVIGEPSDPGIFPLQKALFGSALDSSGLRIYGWVNPSFNVSTSNHSNIPLSYGIVPNSVQLDQLVLRIERDANTVQTDHIDWGFRVSNVFGIDYRYTTAKGWFSNQLLAHNNLYGYDPVEVFGQVYFPSVAQGMILTVGRYLSPPDIESQLAPQNYMFTHSLMFTFAPGTFTGANAVVRLSPQWSFLVGAQAGNDVAPWTNSASLNGQAFVRWTSASGSNGLLGGINSLGSGQFKNGHDDLQQFVGTWGHRFNSRLHMMTEAYYVFQYNGAKGGTCIFGPTHYYAGGGGCGPIIPGRSYSVGAVNYFQVLLSSKSYVSIRTDYFNDVQGQRSGFATAYLSETLAFVHQFNNLIMIRPEARYERAFMPNETPYDNGTRRTQATAAMDLIVRF